MEDLLYGPQVIDRIMKKPEFSFLVKYYSLLYQSLIPNCSLNIKILRRHLDIGHSVELYILSGGSPRLRCQRLLNFLLVCLDNVKDYVQFCDYFNLITIMTDLPHRIITEFRNNGKWGHTVPQHPILIPQKINKLKASSTHHTLHSSGSTGDVNSIDHKAPHNDRLNEDSMHVENINVQTIIDDDGASVYKANKLSISDHYDATSRRRLVVISQAVTAKQLNKIIDVTDDGTAMAKLEQKRPFHMPIPLDLEFMLSSSEWSVVDQLFSPLCDCLPQDYQSTIEKLKSFPQFAGIEQQSQLESLVPPTLTDISVINEKILTFLVMNLCYDANSGGITRLYDVMDKLIEFSESTSCVPEIRCAVDDGTVSLPAATTSSLQCTDSLHQSCDSVVNSLTPVTAVVSVASPSSDHSLVTETLHTHTTEMTNMAVGTEEVSSTVDTVTASSETGASVPGLQLLVSRYQVILQSLPMDYENTLNLLQSYLTDDQLCQILNSSNYSAANKVILDCLIEKFKESVDVSELCRKLELIASLSTSKELASIVKELKAVTSPSSTQEQPPTDEEMKLPQILTVDEDFVQLKTHYHTILRLMPVEYEQSIAQLQNYFSDEQICTILYSSDHTTANKLILDFLIERMSCKEDQLDLCDQLEKIAASSNELTVIIQDLRTGVEHTQVTNNYDKEQPGLIADSFGIMYNMAFSDLRVDPDSKVILVLKKNYNGLCNCLPKDSMVTIKRIKIHVPLAVQGVEEQLTLLPPDHANAMIVVLFIKRLSTETDVLSLCDMLENIVDDGAPKKFIHTLRSELIEALSDMNAVTEDAAYFDRLIFSQMSGFSNSNVLAVLKKHCPKLCDCLPEDYRKTLDRIRMRATVPEGLVQQLAILPSPKQVNHHIVAAMLRPLTNEAGVLGFCDLMESVLDNEQSQAFIERIRNEICEILAGVTTPTTTTVATTVNMIKPFSMPLPSTAEQLTADQKSTVTEASSTSDTSTNTINDLGTSHSTKIPFTSSTEVVTTDT